MGKNSSSRKKQGLRVGILVLAIVVCAWLTPFSQVFAAAGSSEFKVTVTVLDEVAVEAGEDAGDLIGDNEADVGFVTVLVVGAEGNEVAYSEMVVTVSKL